MRGHLAIVLALGLHAACGQSAAPDDERNAARGFHNARIASAAEAIAGANVPTLDPATMNDAEISKVIGPGAFCSFHYTSSGKPILAMKQPANSGASGVVKLNGLLVALEKGSEADSLVWSADQVHLTVTLLDSDRTLGKRRPQKVEADLVFEVGERLRVGYRGYYACGA